MENNIEFNSKKFYDQKLFESENFFAVASVGAIVPGWILIVPKKRVLNFAQLEKVALDEGKQFISFVQSEIKKVFGKSLILFEHGPSGHGKTTGCSVDYAHVHLVPTPFNLLDDERTNQFKWEKIEGLDKLNEVVDSRLDYLVYQGNDNNIYLTQETVFESQLFRKVFASKYGCSDQYNWREHSQVENVKLTINELTIEELA